MMERLYQERLFLLIVQSPIHAGAGPSVQPIDLPTQRDAVTGFPIIRGSELKGALAQDLFRRSKGKTWEELRSLLFGFSPGEAGREEGRVSAFNVLDAHILLFPTSSLYGAYAFVTSPILLSRFAERAKPVAPRLANTAGELAEVRMSRSGREAVVESRSSVIDRIDGDRVAVLHPLLAFRARHDGRLDDFVSALEDELGSVPIGLEGHAILLNDEAAFYVIKHSLVAQPRVRLKYKEKVVDSGPWWEEAIPRYTIMHTSTFVGLEEERLRLNTTPERGENLSSLIDELLKASSARIVLGKGRGGIESLEASLEPADVLRLLVPEGRASLLVGGSETVGRGLIELVQVES